MDFDFDNDIAPLKSQYFPVLVGQDEFDRSMEYDQQVLTPLRNRVVGLQQSMVEMRRQDLLYQRQKAELNRQREQARMDRQVTEMLPEVEERLQELEMSGLTPREQMRELNKLGRDNISLFSNDQFRTLFNLHEKAISTRAAEEAVESAKLEADANMYKNRLFNTPLYSDEIYKGLQTGQVTLGDVSQAAANYKEQLEQQEMQQEAAEMQQKSEARALASEEAALKEMSALVNSANLEPQMNEKGEPLPATLSNEDRTNVLLALAMSRQLPLTQDTLSDLSSEFTSDQEMLSRAQIETRTRRNQLLGIDDSVFSKRQQELNSVIDAGFQ